MAPERLSRLQPLSAHGEGKTAMIIGTVGELWRYPVKSMGGERLDACPVGLAGFLGDRGWAARDDAAGETRGARHLPPLLQCSARYREPPAGGRLPHVDITLPDGTHVGDDSMVEPVEAAWHDRTLRLGELVVQCELPTPRCGMTIQAQADLAQDPTVLRTIVCEAGQELGIYASVVQPGHVAVGDVVELR
jgi:uncharacterized protein YcbX